MRCRHLLLTPVVLFLTAATSACGSGPTTANPTDPGSTGTSSTPAGAAGGAAADKGGWGVPGARCAVAPADLVGTVLGDTVTGPSEQLGGPNAVSCTYQGTKVGSVIVRIQTDQTAAGFATSKASFGGHGMTTTDLPGFGDQAFTSVTGAGSFKVTTVVALRGSTEVLVTGKSTVAAEKSLIQKILDRTPS